MKILLINPSQFKTYGGLRGPLFTPLGLAYIVASLEQSRHEVKIIDIDLDARGEEDLVRKIRIEQPDLVGITVVTSSYNRAVSIASLVKENTEAYTVLGGIHPTVLPKESIKPNSIDFVVKGEGERTMVELVQYLENDGELKEIDGLVFKENGIIVVNRDRALIEDLDSIPFPARQLFTSQRYFYPDALLSLALPIITSRGCRGNCSYCNIKNIFKHKFRSRSAKSVVDEIEYLIEEYAVNEIHIWDDNFIAQKDHVFGIRDELNKRGIRIKFSLPNGVRVDFINEEVVKALKDMGTYSLALGVESGNQHLLNRVKKGVTLPAIENAFRILKKFGIETWGFFMFGLPGETQETISQTIRFAKRLNPDVAKFHILKPYPGTEVYQELRQQGLIVDTNFDNYGIHTKPVHRLKDLDQDSLWRWQKRAYRRFYLRPGQLIKQIFRMSTWHRLKSNIMTGLSLWKTIFFSIKVAC